MAQTQRVFIDLTSDNDDEDDIDPLEPRDSFLPTPRNSKSSFRQLQQPPPQRGNLPAPNGRVPPRRVSKQERPLSTASNGFTEPAAKRRRTDPVGNGSSQLGLPDLNTTRFYNYLDTSLWPKIQEVSEQLAPEYEGRWAEKLHYTVLIRVTDRDFEDEWVRGGYELSPSFEDVLHARVGQLVAELRDQPEQLQSPEGRKPNRPEVHPSIESEPEPSHDLATARNRQADSETDEDLEDEAADVEEVAEGAARGANRHRMPVPRPRPPKKAPPVTPQRLRARVKAKQWQSGKAIEEEGGSAAIASANTWFGLSLRPYLPWNIRQEVLGQNHMLRLGDTELRQPSTVHVDFSDGEISFLHCVARALFGVKAQSRNTMDDLRHLLKKAKKQNDREKIVDAHKNGYQGFHDPPAALLSRSAKDLEFFISDLHHRRLRTAPPQTFTIRRDEADTQSGVARANRIISLLYTREVVGNRAFGTVRRYEDFSTAFKTSREDALEPQIEWTNCAGDIMTLSWVSDTQFICGTTTHSDSHNQQYNKPGNLLLGSTQGKLCAYPDHRIPRPIIPHGDNALDSMVESQDPWLFSSVVDSDYDPARNLAFTSSFDKTVKIWKVREDSTMEALGTWEHEGRVNFVLASKHSSGMVATAADVFSDAVRVYHNGENPTIQTFDSYSCSRILDEDYVPSEKWAYCPAAIRWGLAPNIQHLLLIGYSPRSLNGDDRDIPADKCSTGDLCLWDTIQRTQIKINSIATQNVFEVVWHPSRNSFAVATSKPMSLERGDHNVKTQIRIFELNSDSQYGAIKTLDCPAVDINELTMRPNSLVYSYVAAGCTDGKVYVWDTARSDLPMCVLGHGEPVEEFLGDREVEDVGVKFIAWGTTADRLYTGSSDGVVKVWNIRHGRSVHLRDLIEVPGPITAGAFSPDHTKLVIGDGSGKVYLLSLEDDMSESKAPANSSGIFKMQIGGKQKAIRRPRPFIPHPEVPPPGHDSSRMTLNLGQERARGYLQRGEIALHPHPCIGAIQGPSYAETGLFRAEAHRYEDVGAPLLAGFERHQQENVRFFRSSKKATVREIKDRGAQHTSEMHMENEQWESRYGKIIDEATRAVLEAERAEIDSDHGFEYESCYEYDDTSGDEYMA